MEYIQHFFLLIIQKLVFIEIYQIQKDILSLQSKEKTFNKYYFKKS